MGPQLKCTYLNEQEYVSQDQQITGSHLEHVLRTGEIAPTLRKPSKTFRRSKILLPGFPGKKKKPIKEVMCVGFKRHPECQGGYVRSPWPSKSLWKTENNHVWFSARVQLWSHLDFAIWAGQRLAGAQRLLGGWIEACCRVTKSGRTAGAWLNVSLDFCVPKYVYLYWM